MNEPRPQSKVTLEELLRLKRAERPPVQFWHQFEQDLRTRQLAAAVEKKRWWFALPRVFSGSARLHLPLGATAVLALTFVIVRDDRQPANTPGLESGPIPSIAAADPVASEPRAPTAPADFHTVTAEPTLALAYVPVGEAVSAAGSASTSPAEAADWDRGPEELRPSARSIAANLAVAAEMEPELARFIEGRSDSLQPVSVREPLADVPSPRDVRRNRLFAYMAEPASYSSDESQNAQVRERLAGRLSEDELYDHVRRLSGGGDRLTVKF